MSGSGQRQELAGLLTPGQVADMLGVNTPTVAPWAAEGKLTFVRTRGGHRRYSEAEARALLAQSNGVPPPQASADERRAKPQAGRATGHGERGARPGNPTETRELAVTDSLNPGDRARLGDDDVVFRALAHQAPAGTAGPAPRARRPDARRTAPPDVAPAGASG